MRPKLIKDNSDQLIRKPKSLPDLRVNKTSLKNIIIDDEKK
jgi:hypothetical protein